MRPGLIRIANDCRIVAVPDDEDMIEVTLDVLDGDLLSAVIDTSLIATDAPANSGLQIDLTCLGAAVST